MIHILFLVAWCRGDFEEEQQLDQLKELPNTYSTPSHRTRLCIEGASFLIRLVQNSNKQQLPQHRYMLTL